MADDDLQKPEDLAKMEECEQFRQDIQTIIIRLFDHLPGPDFASYPHSNANTNTIQLRILGLRRLASSRMNWLLWTGMMWATPTNITPKTMRLMGIMDELHQHGISRMTAPPPIYRIFPSIIQWVAASGSAMHIHILAAFILNLPEKVSEDLLHEGIMETFCYALYRHTSRGLTSEASEISESFLLFLKPLIFLRQLIKLEGPQCLSHTGKKLIPILWRLLKWSILHDLPLLLLDEVKELMDDIAGFCTYYSVIRDIHHDVERYSVKLAELDAKPEATYLYSTWVKLREVVARRMKQRMVFAKSSSQRYCSSVNTSVSVIFSSCF
jgi:hypothetical protein